MSFTASLKVVYYPLLRLYSSISNLQFLRRYLIGGIFLCFSPKQKSLCKKGEVDAEPAAEAPGQVEEKPKNDVEAGAASTEDD